MTQDEAHKAAVRAGVAETGESYAEAARRLVNPVSAQAVLDIALLKFGIPPDVLRPVLGHIREASGYPLLATDARDRLKVYLDLKDWVALAKARLGRPQYLQDERAYQALQTATASGQVIVPLSATTYQELSRITSLRQRTDLTSVIAEISGFVTITGRSVAMKHQVLTALTARSEGRNRHQSSRSESGSSSRPVTGALLFSVAGMTDRRTCLERSFAKSKTAAVRFLST